ncbi:MAG TPA: hypothetical protein GX707_01095 [Epulopiscium sp.]|nr:hypothetical protein [Candidatus Epulonipiscium sp.]
MASVTNLYRYKIGKDYKFAMAMGLSFTALTLAAEYKLVADWVKVEDWVALLDVIPTMEQVLWTFTIVMIVTNLVPMGLKMKSKK